MRGKTPQPSSTTTASSSGEEAGTATAGAGASAVEETKDDDDDDGDEATDASITAAAAAMTSDPGRELGSDSAPVSPKVMTPWSDERPERIEGMAPAARGDRNDPKRRDRKAVR